MRSADNLNLMLESVARWDEEVDDFGGTERTWSAIISPGLRYAFNHPNDAQTVIGIAAPIGLTTTRRTSAFSSTRRSSTSSTGQRARGEVSANE